MERRVPIIEAGLSLVSLWWAFVLFVNQDLFADLPRQFSFLTKIMGEKGWGIVFVVCASIKLMGLAWEHRMLRIIGLYGSTLLYGLISAGYIISDTPFRPGTGVHFILMIFALWSIREVKLDGK